MIKSHTLCDHCNADLTHHTRYLCLYDEGSALNPAPAQTRIIKDTAHFCNLVCLRMWILNQWPASTPMPSGITITPLTTPCSDTDHTV